MGYELDVKNGKKGEDYLKVPLSAPGRHASKNCVAFAVHHNVVREFIANAYEKELKEKVKYTVPGCGCHTFQEMR